MNKLSSYFIKTSGVGNFLKNTFDPQVIKSMATNAIKHPLIGLQARSGIGGKKAIGVLRDSASKVDNLDYKKSLMDAANNIENKGIKNKKTLGLLSDAKERIQKKGLGALNKKDFSAAGTLVKDNIGGVAPLGLELGLTGWGLNDIRERYQNGQIGLAQGVGGVGSELLSLAAFGPWKNEAALSLGSAIAGEGGGSVVDDMYEPKPEPMRKMTAQEYQYLKSLGYF